MKYQILYSCVSHIGKCRSMNQDNFICDRKYRKIESDSGTIPLTGYITFANPVMVGVFDGMGGEECGEIASLIAAKEAAAWANYDHPVKDAFYFCMKANEKICDYAARNNIRSMGTTAAFLIFGEKDITLCNIGDSKIYQYADKQLEQISVDHITAAAYGSKPPLSQNLGIPPSVMLIDPYIAQGQYHDGDIYLICSDGLTDMMTSEEISDALRQTDFEEAPRILLEMALAKGGRDNITIIVCKVVRQYRTGFGKWLLSKA